MIYLQGKLEDAVEILSQQACRPYLHTPHSRMSGMARNVDYLCEEYIQEMSLVAEVAAKAQQTVPTPKPAPLPRIRQQRQRFGIVDSLELFRSRANT